MTSKAISSGMPKSEFRVLERASGQSVWRNLADAIRREIAETGYKAGTRLPSETALAQRFCVNRHTVRQAIRTLVNEGVLRVVHGRGTFVQARGIDYPVASRTRYSEILLKQGYEPRREILGIAEVPADDESARALSVRRGAKCIRVETRTFVGEEAFGYSTHLFVRSRLPGIADILRETGSITAALERLGHGDYRRAWTRITAEMPAPELAVQLERPPNRPVLVTESLNVAADGRPLEFGRTLFAGDLCRLTVSGQA